MSALFDASHAALNALPRAKEEIAKAREKEEDARLSHHNARFFREHLERVAFGCAELVARDTQRDVEQVLKDFDISIQLPCPKPSEVKK